LKAYILSPHFDDAAYGLTLTIAQLLEANVPVTIINCFTITKWTALPVEDKDVKSVSALRAKEDADFNLFFNNAINIINLDLLDAPLRNGYIFQSSSLAPGELQLVEQLTTFVQANVDGLLFCPLNIGGHIDHVICRAAVARVYADKHVLFYEDLPYASRITEEQIIDHLARLQEELKATFTSRVNVYQPTLKEQAIRVYKSQLTEEICSEILARMKAIKGERVWGEKQTVDQLASLLAAR
jgi:LmbE family N-acetylglucosaminyl deacetylase